jgi:hypothetical protein
VSRARAVRGSSGHKAEQDTDPQSQLCPCLCSDRALENLKRVFIRSASAAKATMSGTRGRLSSCETLHERLPQDLEDMAAALGQLIQEAHAVVGPRRLARPRPVAPVDQPHIRDDVMGGATRPGRDHRRPVAHEAGDAVDARGLKGLSQGHGR